MSNNKTWVRRRGLTPIPNETVHDKRLSYAALGLLTVLLSRPDAPDLPHGYRDLMGRGLGQTATRRALRELDEAGYRHQLKTSAGRNKLVTHTIISEEPIDAETAQQWLQEVALRAVDSHARSDLHKRGKTPGPIVRGLSQPDGSCHDEAGHKPLASKGFVTSFQTPEQPKTPAPVDCPHDIADGHLPWPDQDRPRCPLCRHADPVF